MQRKLLLRAKLFTQTILFTKYRFFLKLLCLGDPDRYIECIEYLFAELQRDTHNGLAAPVIVNTNGWVRSLGSRLLVDIVHTVSPTSS